MSGWLPIFDTLHGIRGEINLIIKVPYADIFVVRYFSQHCVICRHLDSTVSEDVGIENRTVATLALARSLPLGYVHLIHIRLDLIHLGQISSTFD
jgi:hypothetical protein